MMNKIPRPEALKKQRRFERMLHDAIVLMEAPEKLIEKEYHFDEGLGQSLDEHVEELKAKYPNVTVLTRRDRDGFPVIKTQFKKEYTYDIERMESFDAESEMKKINETLEKVIDKVMPGSSQDVIDGVSANLQDIVASANNATIDTWTKLQLTRLTQAKVRGEIDSYEVAEAFMEICKDAKLEEGINSVKDQHSVMHDLIQDRDRFKHEIHEQLIHRMKNYLNKTERTKSDFVKPRVNESQVYRDQLNSHDDAIWALQEQETQHDKAKDFDKEAFLKLKGEIKSRKDAKERLLNQGLPEFDAYLRF